MGTINSSDMDSEELIEAFDKPDLKVEVMKETSKDPMENLRMDLFEFFQKQMEDIRDSNEFLEVIKEAIIDKIQNEDGIEIGPLIKLFETASEKNIQAKGILNALFQPNQNGGVTPLLMMSSNKTASDFDPSLLDGKTASTVDSLLRLSQALERIEKENKK